METSPQDEFAQGLALALIYLSSWKEKEFGAEVRRAWKGYDFAILDRLKEEGLINFSYTAKSLYLTEEGVSKAKVLAEGLKTAFTK